MGNDVTKMLLDFDQCVFSFIKEDGFGWLHMECVFF